MSDNPSKLKYTTQLNVISDSKNLLNKNVDYAKFELNGKEGNITVIISDSPTASSIGIFSRFMNQMGVSDIFCFSSLEYDPSELTQSHHLFQIDDGSIPCDELLETFNKKISMIKNGVVLFHCKAGLGRAPTMLAYLMISKYGYDRYNAVELIRSRRQKALNTKQLNWILSGNIKSVDDENCIKNCAKNCAKKCAKMCTII
jgi:hypothetical protein